jgi:hypothetical protein
MPEWKSNGRSLSGRGSPSPCSWCSWRIRCRLAHTYGLATLLQPARGRRRLKRGTLPIRRSFSLIRYTIRCGGLRHSQRFRTVRAIRTAPGGGSRNPSEHSPHGGGLAPAPCLTHFRPANLAANTDLRRHNRIRKPRSRNLTHRFEESFNRDPAGSAYRIALWVAFGKNPPPTTSIFLEFRSKILQIAFSQHQPDAPARECVVTSPSPSGRGSDFGELSRTG